VPLSTSGAALALKDVVIAGNIPNVIAPKLQLVSFLGNKIKR